MKVLALDTSTKTGSIAITEGANVLAESIISIDYTHSETLLPSLKNILEATGIELGDIDLFALTVGPGSFTGIRIGVSTVKGLAMSLDKPVTGVSTIEALANNFPLSALPVVPILDARKGEVYTGRFEWNDNRMEKLSEERAISPEELLDEIDEKTLFAGDGLLKYGDLIEERLGTLAAKAPPSHNFIRSSVVASLGLREFEAGRILDLVSFTPFYLRKSEAEVQREQGLLKKV